LLGGADALVRSRPPGRLPCPSLGYSHSMAALSDPRAAPSRDAGSRVIELRQVRPDQLEHVLAEEAEVWLRELDWDFQGSAALVRRFLDMQALSGFCLLTGDRPAGYSYYVCESKRDSLAICTSSVRAPPPRTSTDCSALYSIH
jgi:hypothetical protein